MADGNVPFAPDFDHLIYVRVFEGCNLRCEHCFIPANPKSMSIEDVRLIPEKLNGKVQRGSKVLIQWHGGEPTLFGAKWMRDAIEALEECADYEWVHGIQTNLLTYDDEWKSVYQDHFGGEVGVSYDPKIRVFNGGGRESNQRFEAEFWPKLEKLISDGLDPYLVVTGTKVFFETFKNPIDFFELLKSNGVKRAHIERVTETGFARQNWGHIGVNNAEYSKYMSRFARSYVTWVDSQNANMSERIFLSPFDGLIESIASEAKGVGGGYGCWSGKCDTRFHTIDGNGYKFGCTAINSEVDNRASNNKLILNLDNIPSEREERIVFNCNSCLNRTICNSGCLAIDFDDGSGECSGGNKFFNVLRQIHTGRNE